jgi:VWFA-related protein
MRVPSQFANLVIWLAGYLAIWGQVPQRPVPTFRTETNFVELHVSVTTKDGARVRGLKKEDFEVEDDGKAQAVSVFDAVDLPMDIPAANGVAAAAGPWPDSGVANNAGLAKGRVYVIVMDYPKLAAASTNKVQKQVRDFVDRYVGPNDLAAVVGLGSTTQTTAFTSNKARLNAALGQQGQFAGSPEAIAAETAPVPAGRFDEEVASGAAELAAMEARIDKAETIGRFDALGLIAAYLKGFEGRRKTLIYVSEGVDSSVAPMGSSGLDQNAVASAMRRLLLSLVDSNVSVYSIDPRGLAAFDPYDGGSSGVPLGTSFGPAYLPAMAYLRSLADETGGFATIGFNNLSKPFQRIVEDASSYYVLGYASSHKADGKEHRVRVRVKGRDVEVRTRSTYVAAKSGAAANSAAGHRALEKAWRGTDIVSLLARPLPTSEPGLSLSVTASPIGYAGGKAVMQMAVELETKPLHFKLDAGAYANDIEVAFQAFDEKQLMRASRSEVVKLRLRPESRPLVETKGWRYVTQFEIPPGRYQVRVAASESVDHRTGSVFLDVDALNPQKTALAIAGIALTSESARAMPTAGTAPAVKAMSPAAVTSARDFSASDSVTALVALVDRVKGAHDVIVTTRVQTLEMKDLASAEATMKSVDLADDKPRAFSVPIQGLAPGHYVLTIEMIAAGQRVARSMPIEVTR